MEEAFKKLAEQGAERKALIFKESTKTQAFFKDYLESHGYAGRIVLFNGKASEPQTNEIYKKWCLEHPDKVHSTAKLKEIDTRNLKFFQQEETRIYAWEHESMAAHITRMFLQIFIVFISSLS